MSENTTEKKDPGVPSKFSYQDFSIGFISWFLVNGVIYAILGNSDEYTLMFCSLGVIPINVLAMVILGIKRRFIGLGLLTAFALNLIITLAMGIGYQGICFGPFFLDMGF